MKTSNEWQELEARAEQGHSDGDMVTETSKAAASTKFRLGHSGGTDWHEIAARCLAQVGSLEGTSAFGLIYMTEPLARYVDEIVDFLKNGTGITHWAGMSAPGIMGEDKEYFDQPALAVLTTPFPPDGFRPLTEDHNDLGAVAIVHGDSRDPGVVQRLTTLSKDDGLFMVGGLALPESMRVGLKGAPTDSLDGVAFDPALPVSTGVSQGCMPIGPGHTITAGERNVLLTLDDRPALDVLKEEIGEVLARRLDRIGGYIFAALPVPGSDTGDYLVRNIVGFDENVGAIGIADTIERGARLMFCRRDPEAAEIDLRNMVTATRNRLGKRPGAALYISCLARGPHLFGAESREISIVRETLGDDVPTIGFFANGEIFHDRLYTYTGVLTLFG